MEVLSLSLFLFLSPPGKNRKRESEANRTVTVELGRGLVLQNNPGRVCVLFQNSHEVLFLVRCIWSFATFFPRSTTLSSSLAIYLHCESQNLKTFDYF